MSTYRRRFMHDGDVWCRMLKQIRRHSRASSGSGANYRSSPGPTFNIQITVEDEHVFFHRLQPVSDTWRRRSAFIVDQRFSTTKDETVHNLYLQPELQILFGSVMNVAWTIKNRSRRTGDGSESSLSFSSVVIGCAASPFTMSVKSGPTTNTADSITVTRVD